MEELHQPVSQGETIVKLGGLQDRCAEAGEGRLENHGRMQTVLYGNRRSRRRTMNRLTDGPCRLWPVHVGLVPEKVEQDL